MNEVTQEDREAAADMMDAYRERLTPDEQNDSRIVAANVRLGHFDDSYRVQAFATHRQAAIKAERECIAAWLNDEAERLFSNDVTYRAALYDAADVIASGEHEVKHG